jgi:hypothetical protein
MWLSHGGHVQMIKWCVAESFCMSVVLSAGTL